MHQAGHDLDQVLFHKIFLRLRDAKTTVVDWNCLIEQTSTELQHLTPFANALRLYPTLEAIVEHVTKLHDSGKPVATIKAVHTGANAAKTPADDAGGLEAVVCLAHSSSVMLTSNLYMGRCSLGQWSNGNS